MKELHEIGNPIRIVGYCTNQPDFKADLEKSAQKYNEEDAEHIYWVIPHECGVERYGWLLVRMKWDKKRGDKPR